MTDHKHSQPDNADVPMNDEPRLALWCSLHPDMAAAEIERLREELESAKAQVHIALRLNSFQPDNVPEPFGPAPGTSRNAADAQDAEYEQRRSGVLTADAWQPIETAPKDKTIMLCVAGYMPCTGRWWPVDSCWTSFDWEGHFDSAAETTAYVNGCSYKPTHWMPLPASPSLSSADRGRE